MLLYIFFVALSYSFEVIPFLTVDDGLTSEVCLELINAVDEFDISKPVSEYQFDAKTKSTLKKVIFSLKTRLEEFYSIVDPLWPDAVTVQKWQTGQELDYHSDANWYKGELQRHYSLVCYLNDDFMGGDLHFLHHDSKLDPGCGNCALFTAFEGDTHGVKEIISGTRYTLVSWFTHNEKSRLLRHCTICKPDSKEEL